VIKLKARIIATEMKIADFRGGSTNWIYKFMKRNNLAVRARTTVGQMLPSAQPLDTWPVPTSAAESDPSAS